MQQQYLQTLCHGWINAVRSVLFTKEEFVTELPPWGTSGEELLQVNIIEHEGLWVFDVSVIDVQKEGDNNGTPDAVMLEDWFSDLSESDEECDTSMQALVENDNNLQLIETFELMEQ